MKNTTKVVKSNFKNWRNCEYTVETSNNGDFVMRLARNSMQIVVIWTHDGRPEIFDSLEDLLDAIGEDIILESIQEDSSRLVSL